jgi:dTDP-4-dehydrorhamnose 3,5-epimerase
MLIVVPPRVWHGVQAIGTVPARIVNIVDKAYEYADPDHWRLPHDTTEIPFRFPSS